MRYAALLVIVLVVAAGAYFASVRFSSAARAASASPGDVTDATRAVFAESVKGKAWDDRQDFANAERGLIARPDYPEILTKDGKLVWAFKDYDALRHQKAPPTVNPVLWRQVQLNAATGLFQVADNIYQVRGFDLANMTIIEGKTGIIIIDPLLSIESAHAALELYYSKRPKRPVVTVIYSHSHMDHFGGVKGVISEEDVRSGKVQVIAPLNFEKEAVSEAVFAGNAMLRRTIYYSGVVLPHGPEGTVDAGLGPGVANGTQSFIPPTEEIQQPVETKVVDGVTIEFRLANNTEAPSEMVMYFPKERVLDVAEVAVHTAHNLLTPRGARVRDGQEWVKVLDTLIAEYGSKADVMIGQHHWPTWGHQAITRHLRNQRDFYKFAHDQALHLANEGYTMKEVGEALTLPKGLSEAWSIQDFYGTLQSGGKAIFQAYLGWYDGNPAHLQELPESKSAKLYVDYMGGADAILTKAQKDYDAGNYRWVVEVLNHLIFAQPDNKAAKELSAKAFDQLGYQQISATWRNLFLMAAFELRHGVVAPPLGSKASDIARSMTPENLLDFAGIALTKNLAETQKLSVNLVLTDVGKEFGINVENAVLDYQEGRLRKPDVTVTMSKTTFADLIAKRLSWKDAVDQHLAKSDGAAGAFEKMLNDMAVFRPDFGLVTP